MDIDSTVSVNRTRAVLSPLNELAHSVLVHSVQR